MGIGCKNPRIAWIVPWSICLNTVFNVLILIIVLACIIANIVGLVKKAISWNIVSIVNFALVVFDWSISSIIFSIKKQTRRSTKKLFLSIFKGTVNKERRYAKNSKN